MTVIELIAELEKLEQESTVFVRLRKERFAVEGIDHEDETTPGADDAVEVVASKDPA